MADPRRPRTAHRQRRSLAARARAHHPRQRRRAGARHGGRPRTLFGAGVLRCAGCGAAIVGINGARYGCSAHKDRGPTVCANGATVKRQVLETRLLGALRDELLAPAAIAELQAEVRTVLAERTAATRAEQQGARQRLQALRGEIEHLVDAVATVGLSNALQARLAAAEAERDALEQRIGTAGAQTPAPTVPDVLARYRRMVLDLQSVLNDQTDLARTREILAAMLGTVTIGRDSETGRDYADLEEPAQRLLLAAVGESLGVVAGGRNTARRRLWMT